MREIILPIFKNDDSTQTMEELGLPMSYAGGETGDMVFYNIAAVADFDENGTHLTEIHANGTCFICSLHVDQVRTIIKNAYATS